MDLLKPFRRAPRQKENPVWPAIVSLYGPTPFLWTDKNYALLSKAGYENVAAVFGCVSLIAKTAASIDWYLMNGEDEVEDPRHPLLKLLARPNEYQSRGRFFESVVAFLLLSGNSYILKVTGSESTPRFLYALRPDRVRIQPNSMSLIGAYIYDTGTTMNFKPEEILHLMEFHPTNDFYGLSRLEVAAKTIDIANLSMEWNANILHKDMRVPGAVKVNGTLTQEQRKKLQDDLAKYQGAENVGKIPIFEGGTGGMEWQSMAFTPKEMDWLNSEKFNTRRICSIFGVASELLGDSENKTYSNIKEARQALYMETVLPIMDLLKDDLNYWLAPLFGDDLVLDYDKDAIEALQEDRASKYAYLAGADWLTVNEKREATGYDNVGPSGDVILVGIGKMPLDTAVEEPEEPEAESEPADEEPAQAAPPPADEAIDDEAEAGAGDDGKSAYNPLNAKASFWTEPERKGLLWKAFDRRIAAHERAMSPLVKKWLRQQAERVAKGIAGGEPLSQAFDVKAESAAYLKRFFSFYEQAFRWGGAAGYSATLGKLWDPVADAKADPGFKIDAEMMEKLREQIARSAQYFNRTTWNVVSAFMEEAAVEKLTNADMAQQVWKLLDDRAAWECRRIASTEMTRTDNWGIVEGYKQNDNIEMKGWNCQMLDTSREDHIEADGQEVPKEEDFDIGGYAMSAPGDDRAPAGEVCNCRCSTYPVVEPV